MEEFSFVKSVALRGIETHWRCSRPMLSPDTHTMDDVVVFFFSEEYRHTEGYSATQAWVLILENSILLGHIRIFWKAGIDKELLRKKKKRDDNAIWFHKEF